MATFNFKRYKALLNYSIVENKRNYIMAFGIGILAFTFFGVLFFHLFPNGFSAVDFGGVDKQPEIEGVSLIATLFFGIAMTFMTTQLELVNRYCLQREATQYCLLPATYKEKGWSVITMFFGTVAIGCILYYLAIYLMLCIYVWACNGGATFQPFIIVGEGINAYIDLMTTGHNAPEGAKLFCTLLIAMIPVSVLLNTIYYFVVVTYFKTKAQLKALAVQMVINNVISWVFFMLTGIFGTFFGENIEEFIRNLDNVNPSTVFAVLDGLILLVIPATIAFGWWFFRRLHYKEIR